MVYWIENVEDGAFVASASSKDEALDIQRVEWEENGIDTYIREIAEE